MDRKNPTFLEAFWFWLKLGFISFGGPTGQIAIMHQELVEKKKWIDEQRFLHALNYCMLLPGPEAQQLAIYTGWLLHRTRGGLTAGVLFVLPSVFILWALSWLYVLGENLKWVEAIFYGLKPAVIAIVLSALFRIGSRVLKNKIMWSIAGSAFIAIFFLKMPFPFIIAAAGIIGWIGGKFYHEKFLVIKTHSVKQVINEQNKHTFISAFKVVLICLILWWSPVLLIAYCLGWDSIFVGQGIFFSGAAMVTFGGAYAVLPYVAQHVVQKLNWLTTAQMMDGLGLAETTPGPLIMVLQFVGFVAAWQNPPIGWTPLAAATLGAAITTWVTFVPCFLWIFLGAPYVETLRGNEGLSCALSAVTAAIVGMILNLALWFAYHSIFSSFNHRLQIDWFVIVVSTLSLLLIRKWKLNILAVIALSASLGLLWKGSN